MFARSARIVVRWWSLILCCRWCHRRVLVPWRSSIPVSESVQAKHTIRGKDHPSGDQVTLLAKWKQQKLWCEKRERERERSNKGIEKKCMFCFWLSYFFVCLVYFFCYYLHYFQYTVHLHVHTYTYTRERFFRVLFFSISTKQTHTHEHTSHLVLTVWAPYMALFSLSHYLSMFIVLFPIVLLNLFQFN